MLQLPRVAGWIKETDLRALANNNQYRFLARASITRGVRIALTVTLVVLTVPGVRHGVGRFLAQSFTHQSERLTELYFTDPQNIPSTYAADQPVPISFTLHNLEYQDMSYRYRVYTGDMAFDESFSVKEGAHRSVSTTLPAKDYGQRAEITVELVGRQEKIHFWVERRS